MSNADWKTVHTSTTLSVSHTMRSDDKAVHAENMPSLLFCTICTDLAEAASTITRKTHCIRTGSKQRLKKPSVVHLNPCTAMSDSSEITFKVVVVGPPAVGKTSIARAWSNFRMAPKYTPTTELTSYRAVVHRVTRNFLLLIHDVPGSEEEAKVLEYLRDADAVVLVYNVVRCEQSVQMLSQVWLPRVRQGAPDAVHLLVGNRGSVSQGAQAFIQMRSAEVSLFKQLSRHRECVQLDNSLKTLQASAEAARAVLIEELLKRHEHLHAGPRETTTTTKAPVQQQRSTSIVTRAVVHQLSTSDAARGFYTCKKCLKFISGCVCGSSYSPVL